jgi:hypothetical protein
MTMDIKAAGHELFTPTTKQSSGRSEEGRISQAI